MKRAPAFRRLVFLINLTACPDFIELPGRETAYDTWCHACGQRVTLDFANYPNSIIELPYEISISTYMEGHVRAWSLSCDRNHTLLSGTYVGGEFEKDTNQ